MYNTIMFLIFIALRLLDIATTFVALSLMPGAELNPTQLIFMRLGLPFFAIFNLLLSVLLYMLVRAFNKRIFNLTIRLFILLNLIVVASNIFSITFL